MKIIVLLGDDQQALHQLIEQFRNFTVEESNTLPLQQIGQKIRSQLRIHSQLASEVFYPALSVLPSDQPAPIASSAEKRCEEFEKLFSELSRMKPTDADFEVKVDTVIAEISRHVAMQEHELIHEAKKAFLEYRFENQSVESEARFSLKMIAVI
jgi:Hemerythrin HHE cation binding domain